MKDENEEWLKNWYSNSGVMPNKNIFVEELRKELASLKEMIVNGTMSEKDNGLLFLSSVKVFAHMDTLFALTEALEMANRRLATELQMTRATLRRIDDQRQWKKGQK